jgi:hypothetical protein
MTSLSLFLCAESIPNRLKPCVRGVLFVPDGWSSERTPKVVIPTLDQTESPDEEPTTATISNEEERDTQSPLLWLATGWTTEGSGFESR